MDQKDMYSPCPCGSGKKFKFCCYQKKREQTSIAEVVSGSGMDGKMSLSDFAEYFSQGEDALMRQVHAPYLEGMALMEKGKYKSAARCFEKALAYWKGFSPAANNLSVCLYAQGLIQRALEVQRDGISNSPVENQFGQANLAMLYYFVGEEERAVRHLEKALTMTPASADACTKVCELLARLRRHADILNFVDRCGYRASPSVSFYSGIAAANLGEWDRAQRDLAAVGRKHHKADMVSRYLADLRNGSEPRTVRGDWPYLCSTELCPPDLLDKIVDAKTNVWTMRRVAVDLCEYLLNLDASDYGDILDMLRNAQHPGAAELLWVIVRGTYGSDQLRASALQVLQERGLVEKNMSLKMFVNGAYQDVYLQAVSINEDYQFCDPPPGKWAEVYEKALKASRKWRPNWKAIGEAYWRLTQAVPEFVPGHFNYAAALANQGRLVEAEAILRKLMLEHPDYLFAPAALVRLLSLNDRIAEVEEIIKSVNLPAETHPEAYVAWLLAQVDYFAASGEKAEATAFLKEARNIDPDNPAIDLAKKLNKLGV